MLNSGLARLVGYACCRGSMHRKTTSLTVLPVPDDFMMTAWWLHDDCMMTHDDCLMTACWLRDDWPDDCLPSNFKQFLNSRIWWENFRKSFKYSLLQNRNNVHDDCLMTACWLRDDWPDDCLPSNFKQFLNSRIWWENFRKSFKYSLLQNRNNVHDDCLYTVI